MGILYEIDGADETVLGYAARHDRYNPVARDQDREHRHLLLRTARDLIAGTIKLNAKQRQSLIESLDAEIKTAGI